MLDMDIINAAMVRQRSPEEAAAAAAAKAANAKKTELNQEDFLTLMITQLKNQDPFKPMDPAQYVGQLAQFSSVSGLADINKNITTLTSSLRGNQVLDGAALIGRTVIAEGNQIYRYVPEEGGSDSHAGRRRSARGRVERAARGARLGRHARQDRRRSIRAPACVASAGTAAPTPAAPRPPAPTRSKSSPTSATRTFPSTPASRPRFRASRSIRPPARSRSTPTLSAKSP